MKNKGLIIFTIVLLTICVIVLSGILFLGLTGMGKKIKFNNIFGTYRVSNTKVYDKVYDKEFKSIDIDVAAANIEIKKGDENKLVILGDEKLLTVDEEDTLRIKYDSEPCHIFCFNVKSAKIELTLREDYDGRISIKSDFGDTEVEEFPKSTIEIDSSYGDTKVLRTKNADLSSSCGNIKIGEVENAIIKNDFGDIKINKITNKTEISASCGDIKIDEVELKENSTIENNMGNVKINKTNDIMIESKVSLGDNDVKNVNYKSDVLLRIENDCGDIKVN